MLELKEQALARRAYHLPGQNALGRHLKTHITSGQQLLVFNEA
jgi:hypothetical protein